MDLDYWVEKVIKCFAYNDFRELSSEEIHVWMCENFHFSPSRKALAQLMARSGIFQRTGRLRHGSIMIPDTIESPQNRVSTWRLK